MVLCPCARGISAFGSFTFEKDSNHRKNLLERREGPAEFVSGVLGLEFGLRQNEKRSDEILNIA